METNTLATETDVHAIQCMELWGGIGEAEKSISVTGIDAWVAAHPFADGAGGDIYYLSMCGAGKISRFAVADVAGHGTDIAVPAFRLRKLMRKYINTLDQTRFARALNVDFTAMGEAGRFATALLATYFAPTDHLIICNAGHPRPFWYRAATNTWELLDQRHSDCETQMDNLPLGIIAPTEYTQFGIQLGLGDRVILYTDALTETLDEAGNQLGEAGLLELVSAIDATTPRELGLALLNAIDGRRSGRAANDDQTLMVLEHNAVDPDRQGMLEKLKVMGKMLGLIQTERA